MFIGIGMSLVAGRGGGDRLANWFLRTGVWDDAGEWADAAFWNLTWFLSSGSWNDNLYWSDTEAW